MKLGTILTALCVAAVSATSFSALAQTNTPPTPRPAAGALPQANVNAIQKSFRTQTPAEQQISAQTSPMDFTQAGSARNPR